MRADGGDPLEKQCGAATDHKPACFAARAPMTGSLKVLPCEAVYIRNAHRHKPPNMSNRSIGAWIKKKIPLVTALITSPRMAHTIQNPIHARLKNSDWKA